MPHHEDGMADAQVTVVGPREARASERVPVVSFRHRALRSAAVAAALQARAAACFGAEQLRRDGRSAWVASACANACGRSSASPVAVYAHRLQVGQGIGQVAARTCNEGCRALPLSHVPARVPAGLAGRSRRVQLLGVCRVAGRMSCSCGAAACTDLQE